MAVTGKRTLCLEIATYYSHLNGLEFLLVHKPDLWKEIQNVIKRADATKCQTKVSKEIRSTGHLFYSPRSMNKAIREGFASHRWSERRISYWVTSDARLIRKTINQYISKNLVAVEVQFGKYAFVAYDLFVKHLAFYVGDVIDVGVEILPMKALQQQMSSGVGYYEGELYNLVREGRGVPAVPLILIGVVP